MKAEYNKWYKCKKGTMPEDFENVQGEDVLVVGTKKANLNIDYRSSYVGSTEYHWRRYGKAGVLAWMIPKPYKE